VSIHRVSDEHLKHLAELADAPHAGVGDLHDRLVWDLQSARAEIDRLRARIAAAEKVVSFAKTTSPGHVGMYNALEEWDKLKP
jgi:hypothetical protein